MELQKKPDETNPWSLALRLDYRLTEGDDGADQVGFNWTTQRKIGERLQFTGVVLGNVQHGSLRADGVGFEARASLNYDVGNGLKLGVESFNIYGRTGNFGGFDDQNHQLGPVLTQKLTGGSSLLLGALFGISDAAEDVDLRLWLTHSF